MENKKYIFINGKMKNINLVSSYFSILSETNSM